MTSIRLRSLAGLAVAAAVTLSGCSSVPALNGGVAARVADETVTMQEVADTSALYCSAIETRLADGQVLPGSAVSSEVAGALALRAAADQFAAEQGITADPIFEQAQEALDTDIAELPESQQEAVREVFLAPDYVTAVQVAAGKQLDSGADAEAAQSAGEEAFAAWIDDHDVRIDPRFNITIDGGVRGRAATDVSYPVSDGAKAAVSGEDPTLAAGLPSNQRCG